MTKRIFLDTNILMDFIDNRKHGPEAAILLDMGKQGIICNCVAPITFTTMSYLLHSRSRQEIHDCLQKASRAIEILPMNAAQFQQAMAYGPVRDFEDMMQYQCAVAGGCEVIVTNDRKGFEDFSTLPIMTAEEFLLSMMDVE